MIRKCGIGAVHTLAVVVLALLLFLSGCSCKSIPAAEKQQEQAQLEATPKPSKPKVRTKKGIDDGLPSATFSMDSLPIFDGAPYTYLNDNVPPLLEENLPAQEPFERYAKLDHYGRCGTAIAYVDQSLMPETDREPISEVKPTGWVNNTYPFIENGFLYNRCHLIGYQLTAENANERNLITGTRYLNVEGMLPFENVVAAYIRRTGDAVMYRVIPYFEGEDMLCRGLTLEAYSVKDHGKSLCFYVYCHNVQPGVVIDYATGENHAAEE